jgi:hypothetical protein
MSVPECAQRYRADRPMILPNFLVIGAMKAGTTSLHRYLQGHPEIYLPDRYRAARTKEFDFFTTAHNWHLGVDWYASHFASAGPAVAIGEISPNYSKHPEHPGVPRRIHSIMPDVKFVYLVRDPIERLRSHYRHQVGKGRESRDIDTALTDEPAYLDASRYWMQIEQYLEYFSEAQFLVITTEDLRDRRPQTVARTLAFLGVNSDWVSPQMDKLAHRTEDKRAPRSIARHPRVASTIAALPAPVRRTVSRVATRPLPTVVADISPSVQRALARQLRPDVAHLAAFVGDGLTGWGLLP